MNSASVTLPPLPMHCGPIDEVSGADANCLPSYIKSHRPLVVRGLAKDWPLTVAMSSAHSDAERLARLRRMCRYHPCYFTTHPKGYLHYKDDYSSTAWSFFSKITTFDRFTRYLERGLSGKSADCAYMQAVPIALLPGLRTQIQAVPALANAFRTPCAANFWIGSGQHIINSHFDLKHNLLCLLSGVKRIVVGPPAVTPAMHLAAIDRGVGGAFSSLARLLEFDTVRFPRLAQCDGVLQATELRETDALYLPPCWWHHVESYGLNLMVNAWSDALDASIESKWHFVLLRSIVLFSEYSKREKLALRQALWDEPGARTRLIELSETGPGTEAVAHIRQVTACYAQAGPHFEHTGRLLHDYYVFDQFGPPVELPVGERARMIDRVAKSLAHQRRRRVPAIAHALATRLATKVRFVNDWPVAG